MLLRFKVKNFLSFYEETSFDMFPNPKRTTFENHIYKNMDIPLLKLSSIYGANGSGKSNLLDSVRYIKMFAIDKDNHKRANISKNKFLLADKINLSPVSFSIEFFHQEKYFIYDVELNDNQVQKEELSLSGIGKNERKLIFRREGKNYEQSNSINQDIKRAIEKLLTTNPLSSLLSLNNEFPIIKDDLAKVAYEWFDSYIDILSLHNRHVPTLINLMSINPELLSFTNQLFSKIGLGVNNIEIKEEKLNDYLIKHQDVAKFLKERVEEASDNEEVSLARNDKILFSVGKKGNEAIVKRFIFNQSGVDGYVGGLEYESQSDGTARLMNLIPCLYNIIVKNCVYFIDELECGIHPNLIVALIKYIGEENTKGQLIFTTHETELLDQQKLMRPDELWFAEKKSGNTHLYSLNDFKEHNTINIKNGYIEGRYGAIPFIENLGN